MSSGLTLDEVMALARDLPTRVRSLRVETREWYDITRLSLATDSARGLLARRLPRQPDAVGLIEHHSVMSWMVLREDSWNRPGFDVLPWRWREESETTRPDGAVGRAVRGHDEHAFWWDDGQGARATDVRTLTSLANSWVAGTLWTTAPAAFELLDAATVAGRAGARVRIVPEPGGSWAAAPFHSGDVHELVVDTATGMTLSVTTLMDGNPFRHREVVDFEIDAEIPPELTAAPADAEPVVAGRKYDEPADVARETRFTMLAPTWLPADYTFQTGMAREDAGVVHAQLIFSRDRREFVTLHQQPESQRTHDEVYEWHRVERGLRTVMITDLGDEPGERIAHTTVDGTMVVIYATRPASELLEVAFSLEVVPARH